MMRIGVISDTHGFVDPKISRIFAGVELILHAGDVGGGDILVQLEQIAPITAVLGNNDAGMALRETEIVELEGKRIFLQHIFPPARIDEATKGRLERTMADAVIFGHTHQRFSEIRDGRLLFNPGYAGRPRFDLPRSVAILEISSAGLAPVFVSL